MFTVRNVEHEGRLRKYYHITKQGLDRINEFKEEWRELMLIYKFIVEEENNHE